MMALVVAGEGWGFSLCSKALCPGPSQPLSPLLRDPRALPLPERPAALPSQLSSDPSSAALARASVQQGLPARQQGRRTDGRPRVGSLWQVGFPQAFPSSRANWAGGRLRGPHTTVLTEGSERLSGPVISVGWYCCKIEIHRQGAR